MIGVTPVDPDGFADWYGEHADGLTNRIVAGVGDAALGREAAAEAMARAYARWNRVGAMDSPEGWVYRVAINQCRRVWRRRKLERRALERLPAVSAVEPELIMEDEPVADLVDQLPDRMRTAVRLRYWDDLPEGEVASRMDVAPGTASAMLSQARKKLANDLEDETTRKAEWPT